MHTYNVDENLKVRIKQRHKPFGSLFVKKGLQNVHFSGLTNEAPPHPKKTRNFSNLQICQHNIWLAGTPQQCTFLIFSIYWYVKKFDDLRFFLVKKKLTFALMRWCLSSYDEHNILIVSLYFIIMTARVKASRSNNKREFKNGTSHLNVFFINISAGSCYCKLKHQSS